MKIIRNSTTTPLAALALIAVLLWCGSACQQTVQTPPPADDDGGTQTPPPAADDGEGIVRVNMRADFATSPAAESSPARAITVCPSSPTLQDDPQFDSGLDCDGDGGVVSYVTPSTYKIALKSLSFVQDSGATIDIVADTGTLAASQVLDLTFQVTLAANALPAGSYPEYEAEIYYVELTMPLYDPSVLQTIRLYLSDDDFPEEGNRGHHQGDITLISDSGGELGFVSELWQPEFLHAIREDINGAGGTDAETGHLRGLFGDQQFWDRAESMQGSNRDIFVWREPLGLIVEAVDATVTFSFNVQDTWFFEDFDNNQRFNPCDNTSDACAEGAAWAPLFNAPEVLFESEGPTVSPDHPAEF